MKERRLGVRAFYRTVWEEYADPHHHPITGQGLCVQRRVVKERIRERRPGKILDLGCGPSPVVDPADAPVVICADFVLEMLLHLRGNRGLAAVCLDAGRLPFRDGIFEFVWCGLLVDHMDDVKAWIRELLRVLAPCGTLGLACWERSRLPRDRYPEDRRMRYTTSRGEELSVQSYPTWEEALEILKRLDPGLQRDSHPVFPDEYVLQTAFAEKGM